MREGRGRIAAVTAGAVALMLYGGAGRADELARYEAASEALAASFNAFYVARLPEFADKVPPSDWEEIDRAQGACFMEAYTAARGAAAMTALIDAIEAQAAVELVDFATFMMVATAPIYDDDAIAASFDCGQRDRVMQRATESGLMEIMADPANQARLQAD